MPTLNWIEKDKVMNHHHEEPNFFRITGKCWMRQGKKTNNI